MFKIHVGISPSACERFGENLVKALRSCIISFIQFQNNTIPPVLTLPICDFLPLVHIEKLKTDSLTNETHQKSWKRLGNDNS